MTCKKSYIDSVRKLAIILFLLPAFIQAEVKENYFILDGEFDRYAKKKLQEHKASISKGLELQSKSKYKFQFHNSTNPMDKEKEVYASFNSKDTEIRLLYDDENNLNFLTISFVFNNNVEIATKKYMRGKKIGAIGRKRINGEVKELILGEQDKSFKNKFFSTYLYGRPMNLGINIDAIDKKGLSRYGYVFVETESYIKDKNNDWINTDYFAYDWSLQSTEAQSDWKAEHKNRLQMINGCENFSDYNKCVNHHRKEAVKNKRDSILEFRSLPKKTFYDFAYEFKTPKDTLYFEVNPFDPAILKLIDSQNLYGSSFNLNKPENKNFYKPIS